MNKTEITAMRNFVAVSFFLALSNIQLPTHPWKALRVQE